MSLPAGISESEIRKFIYENGPEHMKEDFVGVFAADEVDEYISLAENVRAKHHTHPFMIANTDPRDKPGVHWWSIIDIKPENELFFFDSFGKQGFSNFIIDNDRDLIFSFLKVYGKGTLEGKNQDKINFIRLKFNANKYMNLKNKLKKQLTETAERLFNFFSVFAARNKSAHIKITILHTQIQSFDNSYCGVFCLYLLYNLFYPKSNSKVLRDDSCTNSTVETVIRDIFFGGDSKEERDRNIPILRDFVKEFNIKGDFEINGKDKDSN